MALYENQKGFENIEKGRYQKTTESEHTQIICKLERKMRKVKLSTQIDIETTWNKVKNIITEIQTNDVGFSDREKKKRMDDLRNSTTYG